jgi:regulator of nucleoside diphosphate kinase
MRAGEVIDEVGYVHVLPPSRRLLGFWQLSPGTESAVRGTTTPTRTIGMDSGPFGSLFCYLRLSTNRPHGKTVRSVMEYTLEGRQKPSIIVSQTDQGRLTTLATDALDRFPEVAEELLCEMERAEVLATEAVPPNVVQMGSGVVFRSDNGETRRVRLVFPGQADIAAGSISILTPIGTALIGLSEGQSIAWKTRDGRSRQLTVLAVERIASEAIAQS